MIPKNKDSSVALVTGASTGIGQVTAKALQNAGFRVFGTSRSAAAETPDGITMLTCDVTNDASVVKLVDEVLTRAGRIDLLVNNAGLGLLGGAEESFDRTGPGSVRCEPIRRPPHDERHIAVNASSREGPDYQYELHPGLNPGPL